MKRTMVFVAVLAVFCASALSQEEEKKPVTLRSILLEQLQTNHNKQDWFVPSSLAVAGLTAEQASWKDNTGNHSIGQLAYHLVFWNKESLARIKGEQPANSDDNEKTFNNFDAKSWAETVAQLDKVMTALEQWVETSDEATLEKNASRIAHVCAHNAYHTGQILYIRREKGWWDPAKGVK
ncbi:MAG: DinB family protein [Acidobacteria bacterium]|nr:DinB family protein [Acidobacteriota bacterium]